MGPMGMLWDPAVLRWGRRLFWLQGPGRIERPWSWDMQLVNAWKARFFFFVNDFWVTTGDIARVSLIVLGRRWSFWVMLSSHVFFCWEKIWRK